MNISDWQYSDLYGVTRSSVLRWLPRPRFQGTGVGMGSSGRPSAGSQSHLLLPYTY